MVDSFMVEKTYHDIAQYLGAFGAYGFSVLESQLQIENGPNISSKYVQFSL